VELSCGEQCFWNVGFSAQGQLDHPRRGVEDELGALLFEGLSQIVQSTLDGGQLAFQELAQGVAMAGQPVEKDVHLRAATFAGAKQPQAAYAQDRHWYQPVPHLPTPTLKYANCARIGCL
jgi:hypothetical protein